MAVGPVVDRIAAVTDPDLRASLTTLAVFLAPGLRVIPTERMRRTTLIDTREDMLAEMLGTWLGRDLISEGLSEGRSEGLSEGRSEGLEAGLRRGLLLAVTDALTARFPDATRSASSAPRARLVELDDTHPIRLALAITILDE